MPKVRNFTGIANHQAGDFMYVSAWIGGPEDMFASQDKRENRDKWISQQFCGSIGGVIGFPSIILSQGMYVDKSCARWGELCSEDYPECEWYKEGMCRPPRFVFDVECKIDYIPTTDHNTYYGVSDVMNREIEDCENFIIPTNMSLGKRYNVKQRGVIEIEYNTSADSPEEIRESNLGEAAFSDAARDLGLYDAKVVHVEEPTVTEVENVEVQEN